MKTSYRELSKREIEILNFLLSKDFPGRNKLLNQVSNAKVRPINEYSDNWGSLEFKIKSGNKAKVDERIPVQASTLDSDNVPITLFLHVINGKINELEIVKADNSPLNKTLKASDLKLDNVRYENG